MSTKTKVDGVVVVSEDPSTIIFPQLFEPKPISGKGEPKYTASFIMDRDEATRQLNAISQAKAQMWPGGAPANCRIPLKSGDKAKAEAEARGKDGSFYAGKFVLRTKSKFPAALADQFGNEIEAGKPSAKLVYSGATVFFEVKYEAYDASAAPDGIPGVRCYLNSVLFRPGGERLIGKDVKDTFRKIISQQSMVDAEAGAAAAGNTGSLDQLDQQLAGI